MTDREKRISEVVGKYASCPYKSPAVARWGKPHTTVDFKGISPEERLKRDEFYMSCAMELASLAAEDGEVPVGAVVVRGDEIISADFNGREVLKNALYHAETAAIGKACQKMGGWRLPGCELFVTLEPCIMCAGAIVQARMPRVVFAVSDEKAGFFGGVCDASSMPLNHKPTLEVGVLEAEARELLQSFFKKKRIK